MQLLSIEDLAVYLGDSKRTIYKYIASGDCPPYIRISAKNIKFDRADVDAWLESKKVYPAAGGQKMSHLSVVGNAKDLIKNAIEVGKLPWSPRAKAVLENAEKQAREDGFDLVGTEHLIFGMLSVKECLGAKILNDLGVTESEYGRRYELIRQDEPGEVASQLRFSEDIDKVIQYAYDQSVQWDHTYIGAEHLLIGILKARAGRGFRILDDLGIILEKVRDETAKLIVCHNTQTDRE
ncbi:MAG: helix-turn-helix domain-containing protein [Sedimentisphaerales bacterium]|nr:helix-turn-helix domain-containing protein [Sedimentisphaerales bacterium]